MNTILIAASLFIVAMIVGVLAWCIILDSARREKAARWAEQERRLDAWRREL